MGGCAKRCKAANTATSSPLTSIQASVTYAAAHINLCEARMSRAHDKAEGQVLKTDAGNVADKCC